MTQDFNPRTQVVELCLTLEEAGSVVGVLGIQAKGLRELGLPLGDEISAQLEGVAMRLIAACGFTPVREDGQITVGPPIGATSCHTTQ